MPSNISEFGLDANQNTFDTAIGDGGIEDAGVQTGDEGLEPDARPPAIQTGRIQCGLLTYSSIYTQSGSLEDGWHFSGSTAFGNGQSGSCGGLGTEAVVAFTAPQTGLYTIHLTTSTGSSPVLYVRETCAENATELDCAQSLIQIDRATISLRASTGSKWYIFADTWQPSETVTYQLAIHYTDQAIAPVIESAALSMDTDLLRFKIKVTDLNADFVSGQLQSVGDAVPVAYPFTFENADPNDIEADVEFNFGDLVSESTEWSATVTDQAGLVSEPFLFDVSPTQTSAVGALCGQSASPIVICDEDSRCDKNPEGSDACTALASPEVVAFEVFRSIEGHAVGAQIMDENSDISFGLIELSGEAGDVIERHLFPVRQQSISTQLHFDFDRQVEASAQTARLILTDDTGQEAVSELIDIVDPEQLQTGAVCDSTQPSTRCAANDECFRVCEADMPACSPMCIERILPSVEFAKLVRNEPRNLLSLSIAIEDSQRIFSHIKIETIEATPRRLDIPIDGWQRTTDTRLETTASVTISDTLRGLSAVQITPIVRSTIAGSAFRVEIQTPDEIPNGGVCDPTDAARICPTGQACFSTSDTEPSCAESTPPNVAEAELYTDANVAYSGLRVIGLTGDAPASALLVRTVERDQQTRITTTVPLGVPIEVRSNVDIAQRFTSVLETVELEVAIQDTRFVQSAWLPLMRRASSELNIGETCQFDVIFGRCIAGTACQASTMNRNTCQVVLNHCSEDWNVQSVEEMDDHVVFNGDSREGYTSQTGSCNFGGQGVIHGFTPNADRLYVARIVPLMPSPIRYPRLAIFEDCGQAISEISCTQTASLAFSGQAATPVYITVSAPPLGPDFPGSYRLEVSPHQQAVLQALEISEPSNRETINLTVEFTPGTEPVTSISIRVLDRFGNALWSPVYGEAWTQSLSPMQSDTAYVALSQIDLLSFETPRIDQLEITLIDAQNVYSGSATVIIP